MMPAISALDELHVAAVVGRRGVVDIPFVVGRTDYARLRDARTKLLEVAMPALLRHLNSFLMPLPSITVVGMLVPFQTIGRPLMLH